MCACGCGRSILGGYHIDHIVPIAKGGTSERRNLQLLAPICNLRKGAK
jgi:5-methylcytosine-specific restriction endonuclease McrA